MDEKQISRITQKATEWLRFQEELQRSANRQASNLPAMTRGKNRKEIINNYLLKNWATGSPAFLILRFLQNTQLKDLGKENGPDFLTQAHSRVKQLNKPPLPCLESEGDRLIQQQAEDEWWGELPYDTAFLAKLQGLLYRSRRNKFCPIDENTFSQPFYCWIGENSGAEDCRSLLEQAYGPQPVPSDAETLQRDLTENDALKTKLAGSLLLWYLQATHIIPRNRPHTIPACWVSSTQWKNLLTMTPLGRYPQSRNHALNAALVLGLDHQTTTKLLGYLDGVSWDYRNPSEFVTWFCLASEGQYDINWCACFLTELELRRKVAQADGSRKDPGPRLSTADLKQELEVLCSSLTRKISAQPAADLRQTLMDWMLEHSSSFSDHSKTWRDRFLQLMEYWCISPEFQGRKYPLRYNPAAGQAGAAGKKGPGPDLRFFTSKAKWVSSQMDPYSEWGQRLAKSLVGKTVRDKAGQDGTKIHADLNQAFYLSVWKVWRGREPVSRGMVWFVLLYLLHVLMTADPNEVQETIRAIQTSHEEAQKQMPPAFDSSPEMDDAVISWICFARECMVDKEARIPLFLDCTNRIFQQIHVPDVYAPNPLDTICLLCWIYCAQQGEDPLQLFLSIMTKPREI